MAWRNGDLPMGDLIVFKRGHNSVDGDWFWALPPASLARHNALVRRSVRRTGRALIPSDGYSTYRPRAAQKRAREIHGVYAAVEGTSSHGGFWEGVETMAIDYGNWAWVYENSGGRAAFYEDVRAVGLTPGMITQERGYPDEFWHVIDFNPKSAVPMFGDETIINTEGDPDMRVVKYGPDIFTFGPQYVKHETATDQAAYVAGRLNDDKNFIEVPDQRAFDALCESFGVPAARVADVLAGRAYNLEGQSGNGRIWSKVNDTAQQVDRIFSALVK
jgi:hypothetical protein